MPISQELLGRLICPLTNQKVFLADSSLVNTINQKIASKSLRNKIGQEISESIEAALVTQDKKIAYPVRQGVPVLLSEESIVVEGLS
jgi:uncharacterized protein YbaR (Trm112 family)